ncbi:MAG: hypothetical protein WBE40_08525 [Thermoplasmata archaeon]
MASVFVVERGATVYLLRSSSAPPAAFRLPSTRAAGPGRESQDDRLPPALLNALDRLPPDATIRTDSDSLSSELGRRLERPVQPATIPELRHARGALPHGEPVEERRFALALAHEALERSLRSPEEILITLTREEERVERAVGREARAVESFLVVPGSALAEYANHWTEVRSSLERHHEKLRSLVRDHARRVVPNLSAVVGERAAARLVSAAGGVTALSRMRAGRIQLLGTRRRPSPERGPRYGILYRADRMNDVPTGRRGAYARSLGALAAIAIRADATTHAAIFPALVARRDRRIEQLRRRQP